MKNRIYPAWRKNTDLLDELQIFRYSVSMLITCDNTPKSDDSVFFLFIPSKKADHPVCYNSRI